MARRVMPLIVVASIVAAACTGPAVGAPGSSVPASSTPAATAATPATVSSVAGPDGESPPPSTSVSESSPTPSAGGACPEPAGHPWDEGEPVVMQTLIEAPGVTVRGLVYPHPDYAGRPWSQWGQGLVLTDGTYLSAIGDHLGRDGNSYLYHYDPATKTLRRIADILSLTDHVDGEWGFGKVHAQMVPGPCGDAYVATYWGTRRDLAYTDAYGGDRLFRVDPASRTIEDLGVVLPERGVPSLAAWPAGGLLYAEVVDPFRSPNQGEFVVIDAVTGEAVFADADTPHVGFRSVAVDADGRAYFSKGDGRLAVFDPASMSISEYPGELPGGWLRAATSPAPDGTIYAATREPDVVFAMTPEGNVEELAAARGYIASLVADPAGATVYYVPDAHGGSFRQGAPLIAVDTATGEDRVVIEMNEAAERLLGVRLGGTYNMAMSADGSSLFIGMNAGPVSEGGGFGEVVLLEVTLAP